LNKYYMAEIDKIKELINEIDDSIICLLEERKENLKKLDMIMTEKNSKPEDKKNFKVNLKTLKEKAKDYNLNENMVEELFRVIEKNRN